MWRRIVVWLLGLVAPKRERRLADIAATRIAEPPPLTRPVYFKPVTISELKEGLYSGEEQSGVHRNMWRKP